MPKKDKEPRQPAYASPRRVLSASEYNAYKENKKVLAMHKYRRQIEERRKVNIRLAKQYAYDKSRMASVGRGIAKGFSFLSSPVSSLYARSMPVFPSKAIAKGSTKTLRRGFNYQRGRPRGTYDLRYAKFGGVYGYRKFLAAQMREQRMQMLRDRAINPQQQAILRQIEAREAERMNNPEGRTIPSTGGKVYLNGIMDEIDAAANIFA